MMPLPSDFQKAPPPSSSKNPREGGSGRMERVRGRELRLPPPPARRKSSAGLGVVRLVFPLLDQSGIVEFMANSRFRV